MSRKYLDDLGVTGRKELYWLDDGRYPGDKRLPVWKKEREEYGFDSRETWDLRTCFYFWLYERLQMFLELASKIVNLEYYKFDYKGRTYTQKEMIEAMIERLRFRFSSEFNDMNPDHYEKVSEIEEMWALVLPTMWW